jgi:hypothetical protein
MLATTATGMARIKMGSAFGRVSPASKAGANPRRPNGWTQRDGRSSISGQRSHRRSRASSSAPWNTASRRWGCASSPRAAPQPDAAAPNDVLARTLRLVRLGLGRSGLALAGRSPCVAFCGGRARPCAVTSSDAAATCGQPRPHSEDNAEHRDHPGKERGEERGVFETTHRLDVPRHQASGRNAARPNAPNPSKADAIP